MTMPERSYTGGSGYRFEFNGKETDDELKGTGNSYDFGARIYNPQIGRWSSVDPLAEKMPAWSSYSYTFNNPVRYTDPTGMEPEEDCCSGMDIKADLRVNTQRNSITRTHSSTSSGTINKVASTVGQVAADITGTTSLTEDIEYSRSEGASLFEQGMYSLWREKIRDGGLETSASSWGSKMRKSRFDRLDIGGGEFSKYKRALNIDLNAKAGYKGSLGKFIEEFGVNSKFKEIIVDNPRFNFIKDASKLLDDGGIITVKGSMNNPYFKKVVNGKAPGIKGFNVSGKVPVSNQGYTQSDLITPIQTQMYKITLTPK